MRVCTSKIVIFGPSQQSPVSFLGVDSDTWSLPRKQKEQTTSKGFVLTVKAFVADGLHCEQMDDGFTIQLDKQHKAVRVRQCIYNKQICNSYN